jgi:replicative DNA helicase
MNTQPAPADIEPAESIVPHSREAEEAALGAVLINPEIYYDIAFLAPDDFYIHRNKWVWEAYLSLSDRRIPIDLLTLSEELDRTGKLQEIGGSAYLTSLINQVPSSLNAESYARIIEGHSVRRKMVSAANKIASAAYNEELTIEEAREIANREITYNIYVGNDEDENSFKNALSKVYDRAQKNAELIANDQPVETGIKLGLIDLDKILLGIEDEESVIVASRPGVGKTSLLLDIVRHNVLKEKKNVAVFSLEMSNEELARRFIAQEAEVDSTKIKTGTLTPEEWTRVNNAIELFENGGQVFLFDISNLTPAQLRAKCLLLKRKYGLDLVVVDYLQLMSAGFKAENRTREVGHNSRQIKLLAKEIKCPIITASQMSRGSEQRAEKRPVLSDLRDAGDIEQDANVVIFLYREEHDNDTGITEAIVAKRRDGATGSASLIYKKQFTKYVNAFTVKLNG